MVYSEYILFSEGYVYLDPKITQGEPRKMIGHISAGKKAVCVKFFYATKGNTSAPITFYIQNGLVYLPVHRVQANTGGKWLENNFSCCLPERNKEKKVSIFIPHTKKMVIDTQAIKKQ